MNLSFWIQAELIDEVEHEVIGDDTIPRFGAPLCIDLVGGIGKLVEKVASL